MEHTVGANTTSTVYCTRLKRHNDQHCHVLWSRHGLVALILDDLAPQMMANTVQHAQQLHDDGLMLLVSPLSSPCYLLYILVRILYIVPTVWVNKIYAMGT